MSCEDYNDQLNALLDGELPPAQAALLAAHLATCPACTKSLAELAELRAGLAQLLPEAEAPAELQTRIEALLGAEAPQVIPLKPRRRLTVVRTGWLAAGALAAALALALMPRHDPTKDLMSVRDAALRGAPGIYAAATPPAPTVPGFQLAGSRMDEVAGHVAQVAYYTKSGQIIVLCIWPANGEPAHGVKTAEYRGMAINYWNDGDHEYWAASLTPNADLKDFVAALATSS
jgi:anti-sigma factor RsiW